MIVIRTIDEEDGDEVVSQEEETKGIVGNCKPSDSRSEVD